MKLDFTRDLSRLREAVNNTYSLDQLSLWAEKYCYLEGRKFSFGGGYEFQRDIMNNPARVVNTVKVAQIGLTTSTMVYMCAVLATQRMNVIYALPSAGDVGKLVTSKLNPIIHGTPELKRLLNPNVDSSEMKQLGSNFLYTRGTKSDTAALSISADLLVIDEVDRCDPDVMKQFRSRLQASQHKIIRQFSTPTMDGVGIAKEAEASVRYKHFATCKHCQHTFLPSYWSDIVIPGYDKALTELDRLNIKDVRWREARWKCPNCGRDPELHSSRLQWVAENPGDNYEADTYYVSPATAYRVLPPSYLVNSSTTFNTRTEFCNQVLGETSQEENSQITSADIEASLTDADLRSSEPHCLGADIGQSCAVTIGRIAQDGTLMVVHKEMVPLALFEERRRELCREYRVVTSVHDVQPETHMIGKITDYDVRAWGAIFIYTKSTELYTTQQKEDNPEEGKLNLRLVKINRTPMLDKVMEYFKTGKICVQRNQFTMRFTSQMQSLKRTQVFIKEELSYSWQKTDYDEHFHMSICYLLTACMLRGTAGAWSSAGAVPLVSRFRLRPAELGA